MADEMDYQGLIMKLLEQEASEEMQKIKMLLMLRAALETNTRATRIPAPMNITEVGGYYNLLEKQKEQVLLRQMVSSALGLPSDYAPDLSEEMVKKMMRQILSAGKEQ